MEEMEKKLSAMLNDPKIMEQVAAMARSLGADAPREEQEHKGQERQEPGPSAPAMPDLSGLQAIAGLAGQGSLDKNQQALIKALRPYLHSQRLNRLEKAMRASQMARMATGMFSLGGLSHPGGERHV